MRTSSHRIGNDRHNSFSFDHEGNYFDLQATRASYKKCDVSGVSTFKLADEAQMGNLSSLMIGTEITNGKCANNNNEFMANHMEVDGEKEDAKGSRSH